MSASSIPERGVVKVVLLGWIGSKEKHLQRLAEWYNSRGFDALTFGVDVSEVLWFDLGHTFLQRIQALADHLAHWVLQDDGRLIFHTFSNTGWLVYGEILEQLQRKHGVMEKIRGCIVDSGGGDSLNPKVWAAGLYAALVKKQSRAESMLLFLLEKFSSYMLSLPSVDRKLTTLDSIVSRHQAPYPHLYLYSTADKVIPYPSVESRMEEQRRLGTKVHSFDFGASGHVDHYRTYPDMYASLLLRFIQECLAGDTQNPISSL